MSTQENKAFIQGYLAALSGKAKTPELVNEFVAEQTLKDHIAATEEGFPEYDLIADHIVAEEDMVSVIGRFDGTHTGSFMGIPPTGKSFADVPIHITYKVEAGKIVDHWMLVDNAALMQLLGLVPSATRTA